MATLRIENFDDELYDSLRRRAEERKTSIAVVLAELVQYHIPTESELAARRAYLKELSKTYAKPAPESVAFRSTEETLREDRER
jgi:hypothetical protein